MIPTQYPLQDILEAQDENDHNVTETMFIQENQPVSIYESENSQCSPVDLIDSSQIDTDTVLYDIDQDETPQSADRTIFVCTQQDKSRIYLVQPRNKVKKTWYNQMAQNQSNVDPTLALDQASYKITSSIDSLTPEVIQATCLGPLNFTADLQDPSLTVSPDSTLQGYLPSGLPISILVDTGCHKTILNRHFF